MIDLASIGLLAVAILIVCWPQNEHRRALRRTEVWLAAGFGGLVAVLVTSMFPASPLQQPDVVAKQSEVTVRP